MWARGTLLTLGSDACISQRGPASGSSEASSKSSSASTLLFQDGGDWIVGVLPSEVTLRVHQGRARNAVSRGPGGEPALVKQAALPPPPLRPRRHAWAHCCLPCRLALMLTLTLVMFLAKKLSLFLGS